MENKRLFNDLGSKVVSLMADKKDINSAYINMNVLKTNLVSSSIKVQS